MRHSPKPDPTDANIDAHDDDFHAAFQHLVGEIFRLNGTLLSVADRLARDVDITPARWQAMGIVQQHPMTVSEIGRRLGIKRQSAQPTINKLVEQGVVRLVPNPGHRRAPLVELTKLGREIWQTLLERQKQLTEEFTHNQSLTVDDLERMTEELRRLRRNAETNQ